MVPFVPPSSSMGGDYTGRSGLFQISEGLGFFLVLSSSTPGAGDPEQWRGHSPPSAVFRGALDSRDKHWSRRLRRRVRSPFNWDGGSARKHRKASESQRFENSEVLACAGQIVCVRPNEMEAREKRVDEKAPSAL